MQNVKELNQLSKNENSMQMCADTSAKCENVRLKCDYTEMLCATLIATMQTHVSYKCQRYVGHECHKKRALIGISLGER